MEGNCYCVVTNRQFPGGGGESYMMDTLSHLSNRFHRLVWICFETSTPNSKAATVSWRDLVPSSGGKVLEVIIKPWKAKHFEAWLRFLGPPTLVHHQGSYRLEVARVCHHLRVPCLTGFHFWNDLLELDSHYGTAVCKNTCIF